MILNHGWPGSFLEFIPIIEELKKPAVASNGRTVAFDVIVPSIPGFGFSSKPPTNWTNVDTARIYNTLMTEVLGYKSFATHGTDWGSALSYILYDAHNETTRAAHFSFLPLFALTPAQLLDVNITLKSDLEKFEAQRYLEWSTTGEAYFAEQSTKVCVNNASIFGYTSPTMSISDSGLAKHYRSRSSGSSDRSIGMA